MGHLKPDTKYIYERANGMVYAREFGADPGDRFEIGYEYDPATGHKLDPGDTRRQVQENQLWHDIRRAAKTNPTLQDALDHAIMIYRLTKTDER